MVTYTVLAWAMFASLLLGVAVSWALNHQLVRALHAIERMRHHWDAMVDWTGTLMADLRRLLVLATVMALFMIGAAGGAWWVTVH